MVVTDYTKMRQELEELISSYRLQEAVTLFKSLDLASVPLKLRADYAQLARRAHLYKEAIKLLQERIYGVSQPEARDLMEYASSLRKLGMVQQCLNLLARVPAHKEKSLYQAYCHVHSWDYGPARENFEKFLHQGGLTEREILVAQVNIISCCIYLGDLDEAERRIASILDQCRERHRAFYLNCLEMKGQIEIRHHRYLEAVAVLTHAHDIAKKENGTTTLFIEKWKLIAELSSDAQKGPECIAQFKKDIRLHGHWETLRDFDYHIAAIFKNEDLLNYVYFGTPFEAFKKRVAKNHRASLAERFTWQEKKGVPVVYNLDPLAVDSELAPFGMIQHRLLLVFLSDFYRPWSIQRIFDSLFPDEIYDVDTSPKRIYGLIKKVQDSIKALNLPFDLQSTIHGYRFRHKTGGSIIIYDQMSFASQESILHYALEHKYTLRQFTTQEMAQALNVSTHKAYRWIHEMEDSGHLTSDARVHRLVLKAS